MSRNVEDYSNPLLQIEIWQDTVNVFGSKEVYPYLKEIREVKLEIPWFKVRGSAFKPTDYNILVNEGENTEINWFPEKKTAEFRVSPQHFEIIPRETSYLALSVTERMRELSGKLLLNKGSAVSSPKGEGALILGRSDYGKTRISLLLCEKGYNLIGDSQIIIGFKGKKERWDKLYIFEGRRTVRLRKEYAEKYFPEYLAEFPKEAKAWEYKTGIEVKGALKPKEEPRAFPLSATFFVLIYENEGPHLEVEEAYDSKAVSLFLSEVFSHQITGVSSPILGKDSNLIGLSPSFDDEKIRKIREGILKSLYKEKMYKVTGDAYQLADIVDEIINE